MYGLMTLALASAASALPLVARDVVDFPSGFGLAILADQKYWSLTAVNNGTADNLFLVAQDIAAYPGSLAYFNGTSPRASLNIDVNGATYGAFVPDAGDVYGYSSPVTVQRGYQDFNFGFSNSSVGHRLTAASNVWLACNETINGATEYVLSWGDFNDNGTAPTGCTYASVHMNCNVGSTTNVTCPGA